MKAFIQTKDNGEWLNENCYASAEGFARMGYDIHKFDLTKLRKWDWKQADVVHGGIKAVRSVIDILELPQPEIHNPHIHLPKQIRREMKEVKMIEIVNTFMNSNTFKTPIFIKPLTNHKLFTGKVISSFADLVPLASVPDDTDVLVSEVVNYISEYRCFVNRRALIGCKNYTGNFEVLPDFKMVYDSIKQYEEQPMSYSIDFGIDSNGNTSLIEINDGFALGAYGLNPILYCKMIRDRWNEITNTK